MKLFFEPETVALIGASANPFKPGHSLFRNLTTCFGDKFYPVNPKLAKIGDKACYPSLAEVPIKPDVAIVFIPAASVPAALTECAKKGVKRVILESGGFAETGPEGAALSEECLRIARANGLRLWGPNGMGLINVRQQKVLSFLMPGMWQGRFLPGTVSLVVQSGMLSAGFLAHILTRTPFGLSKVCSIGNKMDVDEVDILGYLVDDAETEVIGMYLESMLRGREFFELAKKTDKPIVILKSGRTSFGRAAAQSHTASLAQDDHILDGALKQANVIRVFEMSELMDVARSLGVAAAKPKRRPRIAVLSFSGGAGVVSSDDVDDHGMEMARLAPETLARIKTVYPEWMAPGNPVDLYPAIEKNGPMKAFQVSLEAVMDDPGVDAVYIHIFALPAQIKMFDPSQLAVLSGKRSKPIVAWVMGHVQQVAELQKDLEKVGVPVVEQIGRGVRILSALTQRR